MANAFIPESERRKGRKGKRKPRGGMLRNILLLENTGHKWVLEQPQQDIYPRRTLSLKCGRPTRQHWEGNYRKVASVRVGHGLPVVNHERAQFSGIWEWVIFKGLGKISQMHLDYKHMYPFHLAIFKCGFEPAAINSECMVHLFFPLLVIDTAEEKNYLATCGSLFQSRKNYWI